MWIDDYEKNVYVTSQIQEWVHESKTNAWYILLVTQWHEIWHGTKHGYKYKLNLQLKILKLARPKSNGRKAVKHALICRLTPWNHTIYVKLQSNVLFYITTVTYKQQKLSNVVDSKCQIYQQAINDASNMNAYQFLAIHKYVNPIHMYITAMCMPIITKIMLKATILSPLTA